MTVNKIFCTAPFTTVRVESFAPQSPTSSVSGVIFKPACVYRAQTSVSSLEEFWHGTEMQSLRQNKLTGTEPVIGCALCSGPESLGLTSIRQQLLRKPWAGSDRKIKMLDVFFGNVCNLGCIMCGPDYSSYASEERYQAGLIKARIPVMDNIHLALDTMDQLPDLESVSFLGGEFFIAKGIDQILDRILNRNLQCTITTNATVLPQHLLDKLRQVKDLQFRISVDGVGKVYEFIRYPAKWIMLNQNVRLLKQQFPNAEFHISIVVQPLNLEHLPNLMHWSNKLLIPTHYQILHKPDYLSWKVLNTEEKNCLVDSMAAQASSFRLTAAQNIFLQDLKHRVPKDSYNENLRLQSVQFLSKLLKHRKYTADQITEVFGVLDQWAQEINNSISCLQL